MPPQAKQLNLAVIGAGYWGRKAVTEYLELNGKTVKPITLSSLTLNMVFATAVVPNEY